MRFTNKAWRETESELEGVIFRNDKRDKSIGDVSSREVKSVLMFPSSGSSSVFSACCQSRSVIGCRSRMFPAMGMIASRAVIIASSWFEEVDS